MAVSEPYKMGYTLHTFKVIAQTVTVPVTNLKRYLKSIICKLKNVLFNLLIWVYS